MRGPPARGLRLLIKLFSGTISRTVPCLMAHASVAISTAILNQSSSGPSCTVSMATLAQECTTTFLSLMLSANAISSPTIYSNWLEHAAPWRPVESAVVVCIGP